MKGYVQVYTGNGKGKSTAAFGLAMRAVGAGKKVFIGQFLKSKHYSELDSIGKMEPAITLRQFGLGCLLYKDATPEDISAARNGLKVAEEAICSNEYDVVILDEANIAVHFNFFTVEELIEVINKRNPACEVIVTGRYAKQELIDFADLVTEMREVKHYYQQGIQARVGIEK